MNIESEAIQLILEADSSSADEPEEQWYRDAAKAARDGDWMMLDKLREYKSDRLGWAQSQLSGTSDT